MRIIMSGLLALIGLAFTIAAFNLALESGPLKIRALPNAPDGYAPTNVDCPATRPSVRLASGLSSQELDFLSKRRKVSIPAMQEFLTRMDIVDFDVDGYFRTNSNTSQLPNIGIALSGGGYRALLNSAGAIQAFDDREPNSTSPGHLGGLLQSSTYIAGLSGGSWLVGSIYLNNFTSISQLLAPGSNIWNFANSIFQGPDPGLMSTAEYFLTIYADVEAKAKGYDTTITDYWGRALSFQLINATDGGPAYTWSSIAQNDNFISGQQPFPIVIADSRQPGEQIISLNSSVFEYNPYDFAPLEFIGSNFSKGVVQDGQPWVRGFDNAGYVMGTSSSLFNQFLLNINSTDASKILVTALRKILEDVSEMDEDIAAYEPHPFLNWNPTGQNAVSSINQLTLVDGGSDLQNIPFHPLIQPFRAVDVIFAVDSSADTVYHWPNGTSLVATYERASDPSGIANGTSFPSIPDTNTFVNLGLNSRPTFFGCDARNTSSTTPLVVYLPNGPHTFLSNFSTFDPIYTNAERDNMVLNGYYGVTRANSAADPEWPACVGCAIMSRSFDRTGTLVPKQCENCFARYCWDGTIAGQIPLKEYEPSIANVTSAQSGTVSIRGCSGRLGITMAFLGFVLFV